MSWEHFISIISDGLTYDAVKLALGSAVVSTMFAVVLQILKRFESKKDAFYVFVACFIGLYVLFFIVSPKTQGPQLVGGIQQALSGPLNDNNDVVSIITMSVLNAGSMQSIVKKWDAHVSIDGVDYQGSFLTPAPKDFTVKNQNATTNSLESITYHSEDNLVDKALNPIQAGGMATGILFVLFKDLSLSSFKPGTEYSVTFEDAQSKSYSAKIKTTARSVNIAAIPGLRTDLVCKAPPIASAPNAPPPASAIPNFSTPKL